MPTRQHGRFMASNETQVDEEPVGPVLSWAHSVQAGTSRVGGKGWNLGRLARYGFRVPAGGVLTAATYEALVARPSLAEQVAALAAVEADAVDEYAVRERLSRLREAIASEQLPDETRLAIGEFLRRTGLDDRSVAVRSSAVAEDGAGTAFAGIHDSVLGVVGSDAVCAAVLNCFASLWTPQAVAYRRRFGVADDATPCAVVICDLIGDPTEGPIAAGVAFSCDPVTGERGVVTINLAAGAGEAVVSGRVNPQQYAVRHDGRTRRVERTDATGEPAVLDDQHIDALARLVFRVHWALGDGDVPQDVEWAWDGTDFWLLQARPVTRIPRWTFPGVPTRTTTWSNANVRDSFPRPLTVLTWSFVDASAQAIVYASLEVAGYPLPAGMEVMRRFGGRPYFDLDSLQWSLFDAVGVPPKETNRAMGGFQPEISVPAGDPTRGRSGRARLWRRLRLVRYLWSFHRTAAPRIATMIERARESRATDLSTLSDAALQAESQRVQDLGLDYQPVLQIAATYYGAWMNAMQNVLERATGDRAQALVGRLLAASGDVASAEQGYRLRELAHEAGDDPDAIRTLDDPDPFAWRALPDTCPFRIAMERYLDDFGHRAVFEMEFASPRWSEDPSYLLEQIQFHVEHPDLRDQRAHAVDVRRRAEAELADVPAYARPVVRWLLGRSRQGAALRENAKSGTAAAVAMIRQICLEIGRRLHRTGHLATPDDVFHLGFADMEAFLDGLWDGSGAAALVEDRKLRLADQRRYTPPGVVTDAAPSVAAARAVGPVQEPDPTTETIATSWTGVAAAPGTAAGKACVLETPHDGRRMRRGDVLVAPSTDPGWTPLFLRASAVVMETGGYLSHGAVVAREYGLPAVVNVHDAMRNIRDDDDLQVDGDAGRVSRRV